MADTPPSPEVIQAITASEKQGLGFIFVGFVLATSLYGISLLQTYLYFRQYTDGWWLKIVVLALIVTDSLSTALVSHAVFTYLVTNLGNIIADTHTIWSFNLENGVLSVTTLIAQGFYIIQIFKVGGSRYLVAVMVLLALAAFALGIEETVNIFQNTSASTIAATKTLIIGGLVQGFAALCDIIITISLVYLLREKKAGIMNR
jgi:hypothetical protein